MQRKIRNVTKTPLRVLIEDFGDVPLDFFLHNNADTQVILGVE